MTTFAEETTPSVQADPPIAPARKTGITYQVDLIRSAPARLALALACITLGFVFMCAFSIRPLVLATLRP